MSKKLVELKPCPFCGGEAVRVHSYLSYRVECANVKCNVRAETYTFDRQTDATKAWNKRAAE